VDVREADRKGGSVTNAIHNPYAENNWTGLLEAIKRHNPKKLVFFCMYGRERSPTAASNFLLHNLAAGAPKVYILIGGFQAWLRYCAKADLATKHITGYDAEQWVMKDDMGLVYRKDVEDDVNAPKLRAPSLKNLRMQSMTLKLNVSEDHRFNWIDSTTLAGWIAAGQWPVIVDVRSEDFEGGAIPTSLHIPFANFTVRKQEVSVALRESKSNIVVFLCMNGKEHSPTCAMKFLADQPQEAKIQVFVLRNGFPDWLNFCLNSAGSSPLRADTQVVGYNQDKWVSRDKFGMTYRGNDPA